MPRTAKGQRVGVAMSADIVTFVEAVLVVAVPDVSVTMERAEGVEPFVVT